MAFHESLNNGRMWLCMDVKFNKLGMAYAYGECLAQRGNYPHYAGSKNLAYYQARKFEDARALEPIKHFADVDDATVLGHEILSEMLAFRELSNVHGIRGKLDVFGNRMTLVYLQALAGFTHHRGIQFVAFEELYQRDVNANQALKAIGERHALTGMPYNPMSSARAMALAISDKMKNP